MVWNMWVRVPAVDVVAGPPAVRTCVHKGQLVLSSFGDVSILARNTMVQLRIYCVLGKKALCSEACVVQGMGLRGSLPDMHSWRTECKVLFPGRSGWGLGVLAWKPQVLVAQVLPIYVVPRHPLGLRIGERECTRRPPPHTHTKALHHTYSA